MKKIFITLIISLLLFSCSEKEPTSAQCNRSLIVSDKNYQKAKDESDFKINDVSITGDCMTISYSYGGGCGSIETELLAPKPSIQHTGSLYKRELKLSINDMDNCKALIMKSEEFDISALQGDGANVILRLHKWDTDILYTY
jgi:hypothetical protein